MKTLLSVIFFSFCFGAYSQKYETGKHFINKKKDTIYITPEQMPEFPGGISECLRFVGRNIDYISDCCGQYRVIAGFIINEDGSISDIEIMKSECEYCDKEAQKGNLNHAGMETRSTQR